MNETLLVNAIKNGTVIDHITAGQALRILRLLGLKDNKLTITVGLHLPSKRIGHKDLIKIENRVLTEDEANEIVVFAPTATINVIEKFKVAKKFKTHLPTHMKAVFICPNSNCITHSEMVDSLFYITQESKAIKLTCHYCNKIYNRDQVKVII